VKAVVVDASLALAWCFDERESAEARKLLEEAGEIRMMAPALWELEVANGLMTAERHGRLAAGESTRFLELLEGLGVEIDEERGPRLVERVVGVARRHGLTAYDAAYLELAERRGGALASFDQKLRKAARKAGVAVWVRGAG
jgi:predicted nucleic acid-binding protein